MPHALTPLFVFLGLIISYYFSSGPRNPGDVHYSVDTLRQSISGMDTSGLMAYQAVDRQCGSCHHGDRSTNMSALDIFDLRDSCWYCGLSTTQVRAFNGRMNGSAFTEEEKTALQALLKSP